MHREQAALEFSLYLVAIGIIRKREAAYKRAVTAFDAVEFPFLLFLLELAFAGDGQHAVFDGDFYVLSFQLGQLGLDEIFFLIFGDVRQRHPIGQRDVFPPMSIGAAKRTAKEGGEIGKTVLEILHFSEWFPASNCLHMNGSFQFADY